VDATPASRTAVLVCQGRAVADGRIAPGRFADPIAVQMLDESERGPVAIARAGVAPKDFANRFEYEMLVANAEVMAPRTIAIDDAIRGRTNPQLVILGAGLDDRAWRMAELADVDVFEVDHPASQADKRRRAAALQPVSRAVHLIAIDLAAGDLGVALGAGGHRNALPTTWVWEGVVPYLEHDAVEATVRSVAERSAPGSRLIVNYQSPSWSAAAGRLLARAMARLARRPDPLGAEPRRSSWTPATIRALLRAHGFTVVHDTDLLTLAQREDVAVRHPRSLQHGRVAIADD